MELLITIMGKVFVAFFTFLALFPFTKSELEVAYYPLRENCPYLEVFRSAFSRICTEYGEILSVYSPNAGKYGPE